MSPLRPCGGPDYVRPFTVMTAPRAVLVGIVAALALSIGANVTTVTAMAAPAHSDCKAPPAPHVDWAGCNKSHDDLELRQPLRRQPPTHQPLRRRPRRRQPLPRRGRRRQPHGRRPLRRHPQERHPQARQPQARLPLWRKPQARKPHPLRPHPRHPHRCQPQGLRPQRRDLERHSVPRRHKQQQGRRYLQRAPHVISPLRAVRSASAPSPPNPQPPPLT